MRSRTASLAPRTSWRWRRPAGDWPRPGGPWPVDLSGRPLQDDSVLGGELAGGELLAALTPASTWSASSTSCWGVSSGTRPISCRYIRTGSDTETSSSAVMPVASASGPSSAISMSAVRSFSKTCSNDSAGALGVLEGLEHFDAVRNPPLGASFCEFDYDRAGVDHFRPPRNALRDCSNAINSVSSREWVSRPLARRAQPSA